MNRSNMSVVHKTSNWLLFLSVVMMILGILAITFSFSATLASIIALGSLIFIAGIVLISDSFKYWSHTMSFILHVLVGLVYVIVGVMLIDQPLLGSLSLTLFLGIFYVIVGAMRLINAGYYYQGWNIVSGLLALLIGILIIMSWPSSSLFVIGLFVGIDLLVYGWTLMMIAIAGKSISSSSI